MTLLNAEQFESLFEVIVALAYTGKICCQSPSVATLATYLLLWLKLGSRAQPRNGKINGTRATEVYVAYIFVK